MIAALIEKELPSLMADVPKWHLNAARDAIEREFEFADFLTAIDFMNIVALIANRSGHHPEWSNVYNRVHILLTTHDAGGLSLRDIEMANKVDAAHLAFFALGPQSRECQNCCDDRH
jgi:4a-hydroxytetrahydrobiopterin dehydratase